MSELSSALAVETRLDAGVLSIELNRPDRLNALNFDSLATLTSVLEDADSNPDVRVITLSGRGRGFCSGWDRHAGIAGDAGALRLDSVGRGAVDALHLVRQPTIAVLQGPIIGGGVVLAASCDLRIASSDAYFWLPEGMFGSPLLWTGLAPLVREVGFSATRDLAFMGEKRDVLWAREKGLVHDVHTVDAVAPTASRLAQRLAELPPAGVQGMKRDLAQIETHSIPRKHPYGASDILEAVTSDSFRAAMSRSSAVHS